MTRKMDTKIRLLHLLISSLLIILLLLCGNTGGGPPRLAAEDVESAKIILNTTSDIVQDTNNRLKKLSYVRNDNSKTLPYEMGYLNYMLYDKYRRMIDIYNSSAVYLRNLYIHELIMKLDELEHLYWDIEHIANMIHEVERKYGYPQGFEEKYNESYSTRIKLTRPSHLDRLTRLMRKIKKPHVNKKVSNYFLSTKYPPPKPRPWSWPKEYGWEVDYIWRRD